MDVSNNGQHDNSGESHLSTLENGENIALIKLTSPIFRQNSHSDLFIALLSGCTMAEAAKRANITERWAFSIAAKPEFEAELRNAKSKLLQMAETKLLASMEAAIEVLTKTMTDDKAPPGVKVRAASALLDRALVVHETNQLQKSINYYESIEVW
jgi:hypothetical protein